MRVKDIIKEEYQELVLDNIIGLLEGVGDAYAEKKFGIPNKGDEFENRWQQHQKTQQRSAENGELAGQVTSDGGGITGYEEGEDFKVNIYKNPKSLKNFEDFVRAVGDDQGNVYVAQINGSFYHENIEEEMGLWGTGIKMYRVEGSNLFGTSGTYQRQATGQDDISSDEAARIISQDTEIMDDFKKLNNNNPNLRFSYLAAFNLVGTRTPQEDIDASIVREGAAIGDDSGYMQMGIKEVGEANLTPYQYKKTHEGSNGRIEYEFKTDDDLNYMVFFNKGMYRGNPPQWEDNTWAGGFGVEGYDDNEVTNAHDVQKVMSTVMQILRDFVKEYDPQILVVEPSKADSEDKRRLNMYLAYAKKLASDNYWVWKDPEDRIVIEKEKGIDEIVMEEIREQFGYDMKAKTPELNQDFWNWFGKSQVLDGRGLPAICYHQTRGDFDAFKTGGGETWSGPAMWFAPEKIRKEIPAYGIQKNREADAGQSIMPVYLRIERPLIMNSTETFQEIRKGLGIVNRGFGGDDFPLTITQEQVDELKEDGYDGIFFSHAATGSADYKKDKYSDEEWVERKAEYGQTPERMTSSIDEVIVFDPDQIKSVYNQGTWSTTDDNVLKEVHPYEKVHPSTMHHYERYRKEKEKERNRNKSQEIRGLDYQDGEEGPYDDENIDGIIRIDGNDVEILDWNSINSLHGSTETSLKRLKQAYGGEIRAVDAGYPGDKSFSYWMHMMKKGLVDGVYDDDMILHDTTP